MVFLFHRSLCIKKTPPFKKNYRDSLIGKMCANPEKCPFRRCPSHCLKCTKIVNFITTRYEVIVSGCCHIDDFMKMIDFIRILSFTPGHRENLLNHDMFKEWSLKFVIRRNEEMSIVTDNQGIYWLKTISYVKWSHIKLIYSFINYLYFTFIY